MPWRIRQAAYADLEAAARTKAEAWADSLLELTGEDVIRRQRDPERISRTAAAWAEVLDGGGAIWLVVGDGGEVVGVAHAGIARDEDAPTPLELAMIYLRTVAQGSGVADALLEMAIGDAPAYLWVLRGNTRAQAFYRRHGFAFDGTTKPLSALDTYEERWVRTTA